MTLLSSAIATWGKFQIGTGGTEYAVLGRPFAEVHEIVSAAGSSTPSIRKVKWTFKSMAEAADDASLPALKETLRALARIGERVRVTEHAAAGGAARDLPASGAAGGSINGYPRVAIEIGNVHGVTVEFKVTAEAEIVIPAAESPSGYHLVMHEWSMTTDIDAEGLETITRRGTVRVNPGQNARNYTQAVVIDVAEAAAVGAGHNFTVRWTEGNDSALVQYEYTDRDPGADFGSGIVSAEITDRTSATIEGRRERTVSGYATGSSATAFAEAQAITGSATVLLTRREISEPREPDGRVDFTFGALTGVAHDDAPVGAVLFSLRHEYAAVSGGRERTAAVYADSAPLFFYGPTLPYVYEERITVEFTGCNFDAMYASDLMDFKSPFVAASAVGRAQVTYAGGTPLKRIELRQAFAFATAQTVPEPLEIPGVEA